jgi:hypothetical protein
MRLRAHQPIDLVVAQLLRVVARREFLIQILMTKPRRVLPQPVRDDARDAAPRLARIALHPRVRRERRFFEQSRQRVARRHVVDRSASRSDARDSAFRDAVRALTPRVVADSRASLRGTPTSDAFSANPELDASRGARTRTDLRKISRFKDLIRSDAFE